jgi:2-polyprenyl-6-hydroxyphenyl methylase/3-demethylubiquinone-9 3-methyltransferase
MIDLILPDFNQVEEAEKYNQLAALGWVSDVWPKIMSPLNQLRFSYWRAVVGDFNGLRVLDLGCGYGLLSETLERVGANVVGVDPSEGLIDIARQRALEQGFDISYHQGYAEELSLDGLFDVVMAADVLEHVNDLERTLALSSALLKEGGVYCFLTNNKTEKAKYEIITRPEVENKILPHGYHDYDKFIEPDRLSAMLKQRGIVVKEMKGISMDIDTKTFSVCHDLCAMYIGYGIKE